MKNGKKGHLWKMGEAGDSRANWREKLCASAEYANIFGVDEKGAIRKTFSRELRGGEQPGNRRRGHYFQGQTNEVIPGCGAGFEDGRGRSAVGWERGGTNHLLAVRKRGGVIDPRGSMRSGARSLAALLRE